MNRIAKKSKEKRGGVATACVTALLALLAFAPAAAQANYDPIASGATRLTVEKSFLALLKENGVKLSALAPAKLKGTTLSFPVSGGKFDPTTSAGTVEHEGGLLFKAGARKVPLSALQLKTTSKHTPFSVKAGGGQLKLAAAKSLAVTREGFANKVKVTALTLSAKVATRLDKKLHLRGVFKEGQPLGRTLTKTQPVTTSVLGQNKASLSFDPAFAAKLASLFVATNPIFPAEHPGPFTLPIFAGTIAPSASTGTVETQGTLELIQQGGGQVFWHEPWIELATGAFSAEVETEPSPPYAGKTPRTPIAALALPTAAVADAKARTVTVTGASLTLPASTAALLNEIFAKPLSKGEVFKNGEALGTLSFGAQGQ
ncbi:MAG: hypothetical protein H0X42_04955 [Solirubrobacterales bacterium]|nr:hypothetical protein [Solirubrobacterales bacterium]